MKQLALVLSFALVLAQSVIAAEVVFLKQNSEPKYLANGAGLCDQIYVELGKQLASDGRFTSRVDPSGYPVKRLMMMLEAGQGTLFCGATQTPERDKNFTFSKLPAYTTANMAISAIDEPVTDLSVATIKQKKIVMGALFGTSTTAWLQSQIGPELVFDQIYSVDDGVELVTHSKEPRYFFYHDLALNYAVARHPGKVKLLPTVYRLLPQWLIFSPQASPELIALINQIMADLDASGRLGQIQGQFLHRVTVPPAG